MSNYISIYNILCINYTYEEKGGCQGRGRVTRRGVVANNMFILKNIYVKTKLILQEIGIFFFGIYTYN